jgi:hypothetical protein
MKLKHILLFSAIVFFSCCKKDVQPLSVTKPADCDSMLFTYSVHVRPIVAQNCSGATCHSGNNSNYNYSIYEVLADRIRSGRLEERLLLPVSDPMHMPEGFLLTDCDLYILRTWIHQGFKNN